MDVQTGLIARFGPFRLLPEQRLLLCDDEPVRLGSRAMEILITLIERAGRIVSKDELLARIWPDTTVDESNLKVNLSAVRRALGDRGEGPQYIETVPGQGYRFVAPLTPENGLPVSVGWVDTDRSFDAPLQPTRIFGRESVISFLVGHLPRSRMLTIVGPGGIGKTTVAVAVGHALVGSYRDGVFFVDLAPLAGSSPVYAAVAAALRVSNRCGSLADLVAFVRDKRMLLVVDNCEHVVDAAAAAVSPLLAGAPDIFILATSREPLRVSGEHVHRLAPLQCPPPSTTLSTASALSFSAIQLLVDSTAARVTGFALSDADAPAAADICRKLDGIPLAIELVAARVETFGIAALAGKLNDRFRLLTSGDRGALPRQQTLRATLDWSYELLTDDERVILRRLAIFAGPFTLASAIRVAVGGALTEANVIEGLGNLVARSLLMVDPKGAIAWYRLLNTTRAYAVEKLSESGEENVVARRSAEYFREVFERAERDASTERMADWLSVYGRRLDNARAALDWSFSPAGDPDVGVALTIAAVPLWAHLSFLDECHALIERALSHIGAETAEACRRAMQLRAMLALVLAYGCNAAHDIRAAWSAVLEAADRLDDADYRLRAIWGLWTCSLMDGDYQSALALVARYRHAADSGAHPEVRPIADRMAGFTLHLIGDQHEARQHLELMLERYTDLSNPSHIVRYQFDQRVVAQSTLAWVEWLQGFPDRAMRIARQSVLEAEAIGHNPTLFRVLSQTMFPIAFLCGDVEEAERVTDILVRLSSEHSLRGWNACGQRYRGAMLIDRGDADGGLKLLLPTMAGFRGTWFGMCLDCLVGTASEALAQCGQFDRALDVIDDAIARSEQTGGRWFLADLLRVKGRILLLRNRPDAAFEAATLFAQALAVARDQGTLSLELRAAMSLAQLRHMQARTSDARRLLADVYDRFVEGFETADLIEANALLTALGSADP